MTYLVLSENKFIPCLHRLFLGWENPDRRLEKPKKANDLLLFR